MKVTQILTCIRHLLWTSPMDCNPATIVRTGAAVALVNLNGERTFGLSYILTFLSVKIDKTHLRQLKLPITPRNNQVLVSTRPLEAHGTRRHIVLRTRVKGIEILMELRFGHTQQLQVTFALYTHLNLHTVVNVNFRWRDHDVELERAYTTAVTHRFLWQRLDIKRYALTLHPLPYELHVVKEVIEDAPTPAVTALLDYKLNLGRLYSYLASLLRYQYFAAELCCFILHPVQQLSMKIQLLRGSYIGHHELR